MLCNVRPNGVTNNTSLSPSTGMIGSHPDSSEQSTESAAAAFNITSEASSSPPTFSFGVPEDRPGSGPSTSTSGSKGGIKYMEQGRPQAPLDAFIRGRAEPQDTPCSFLSVGQAFEGTQHVSQSGINSTCKDEAWKVVARLQGCDPKEGYLCGSMETLNVPSAKSSVVTFWEGEIVDNINHTFFTAKHWGTDRLTDLKHWSKFSSFAPIKEAVNNGRSNEIDLANFPYVFMRWKEKCFVNVGPDCGLTIAGFYYICLARLDGCIHGFYYDPNSSPFQKLHLKATGEGRSGQSFGSYSFR